MEALAQDLTEMPFPSALHYDVAGLEPQRNSVKLNRLLNHPEIYPWVKGDIEGEIDLTPLFRDPRNKVLMGEYGAMVFHCLQNGYYEVHTNVLPEGRGQWTIGFVQACLHWMFTGTDMLELVTRVPKGNSAARALVKIFGLDFEFTNPRGWVRDGKRIPAGIYSLTIQKWARSAPGLEERGEWFHQRLEQEFRSHGRTQPQHDDDAVHDRYVGMAMDMCFGGQPQKAVAFYNRWAMPAGYLPVSIEGFNPLTIDIGNALIIIRDNDFWVPTCQPLQ